MSGQRRAGEGRLERSMLFVPALRWSMLEKAAASDADAICIDLEDSVPPSEKVASRANVVRALKELNWGGKIRMFRINALNTPWAFGDLAEVVGAVGDKLDVVMVPKVASPLDLAFVSTLLSQVEAMRGVRPPIGIEAQIENAAGFLNVRAIAGASPRLEALVFGQGDYSASMRMPATGIGTTDENDRVYPGHRYHSVTHEIVAAARANGLRCIDGPYSAYGDSEGFELACRVARVSGFDGKQCIHPAQLATANRIFSPTDAEAEHARRVVDAHARGAASGSGAVSLDGKMVDEANVRMARVVLDTLQLMARNNSR